MPEAFHQGKSHSTTLPDLCTISVATEGFSLTAGIFFAIMIIEMHLGTPIYIRDGPEKWV